MLSVSAQRLWKRGLDRGCRAIEDDLRSPRGRIDIPRTVARQLEPLGLAACLFDELEHDVLHNQILAPPARRRARLPQLHKELRAAMVAVDRTLADVSTIPIRSSTFTQIQRHGRLRCYRLPLRPPPKLQYQYGPHRVTATGVDLAQDWRAIHQRPLEVVETA